jgi:hypothetical protein
VKIIDHDSANSKRLILARRPKAEGHTEETFAVAVIFFTNCNPFCELQYGEYPYE